MENEEKQNLRQQQQRPMEQEPPPPPKCRPFPLTVPLSSSRPYHPYAQVVIAHRGASAHLPEHSLAAYRLALELGADYLEPDLVSTQDRHLVALHSLDLTTTTNVLEVYGQSKNQTASPYRDGQWGYWVYDFTLAELKRLRLKQRLAKTQEDPNFGGGNNSLWYDRSTAFDGLFEVPTLSEILQLLQDWNEQVQPLWYNTETTTATTSSAEDAMLNKNNKKNTRQYYAPPPPRGLYAELKDYPWLLQDTKMNLIDIFFEHLTGTGTQVLWQHAVVQHMCETKIWNEHYEYKLPPLIIQAFEGDVLEDFTARWEHLAKTATTHSNTNQNNTSSLSSVLSHDVMVEIKTGGGNETETTNTTTRTTIAIPVPPPPMILLLPYDKCRQEPVWFDLEEKYRHVLAGIGPDKRCFFDSTTRSSSRSDDDRAATLRYNPFVMDKANKLSWVVHPWTERPEKSFFVTTTLEDNTSRSNTTPFLPSPFATVLEELRFLKCTVHVHGIFSESVDLAVRAMTMPCPSTMEDLDLVGYQDDGGGGIPSGDTNGRDGGGRGGLGYFFMTNDIPLGPVILFSFLSGILTALVVFQYCGTGPTHNSLNVEQPQQRRRRRPSQSGRRQSYLAPPTDINDDDDDNSIVRHRDNRVGVPLDNENDHEIL